MLTVDVFSIPGRGTVVTGRVERGTLKKGADVEIVGIVDQPLRTTVTGIEMFKKELDQAMAGDNLGLLLRGLRRDQLSRGMVVAVPGSLKPAKKFLASFYILTKDEGGRSKGFTQNYRPQLYARTCGTFPPPITARSCFVSCSFLALYFCGWRLMRDMTVSLTFPKEMDKDHMVMPGDNCELVCEMFHPIALDKGMRFTIRILPPRLRVANLQARVVSLSAPQS